MKLTRQEAIDAECRDCSSSPLNEGTWRQQVELYCYGDCPLSKYRPVTIAMSKLQKQVEKTRTRQEAIVAKCRDCIYDNEVPGTWRAQVEACPATDCSIYPYRPATNATKKRLREERLATMTPEELRSYREKQENARMRLSAGKKQQENDIPVAV